MPPPSWLFTQLFPVPHLPPTHPQKLWGHESSLMMSSGPGILPFFQQLIFLSLTSLPALSTVHTENSFPLYKKLLHTLSLHTACCLYLQAFSETWFSPKNVSFLLFLSDKRWRSLMCLKTVRKRYQHYLSSKLPLSASPSSSEICTIQLYCL